MSRLLTIGMPCYDDFDGVFFTLQSLRLYHPEVADEVEFLIVDDHSNEPHAEAVRVLVDLVPEARLIQPEHWTGPWVKGQLFEHATTPFVLCMDCHVLLPGGVLARLLDFYRRHPDTLDLHQGPLLNDEMTEVSTHFEPVWRDEMWGIWATDERGVDPDAEPFEIPMQGMGLFTCAASAWPGFNPMFRGFGGEEGYIHTKFRQAGRRTVCLPFLRWLHRFERPNGISFPLTWENKVRNYFIGFLELGLDVEPIVEHFSEVYPRDEIVRLLGATEREIEAGSA